VEIYFGFRNRAVNSPPPPWLYSPVYSLASSTIFFHLSLSYASLFQSLIPIHVSSLSTSSIHLILGIPTFFSPGSRLNVDFLTGSLSLIGYVLFFPAHLSLANLNHFTISCSPYFSSPTTHLLRRRGRGCIAPTHSRPHTSWSEWSASRPDRSLAPGKGPPVPIVQKAGWAPEPVWTQRLEEKSLASAVYRTSIAPVVQSVARHYTD
jgi:hypothetical protein